MSTRFHTPTAPPAAIRPPRATNRAGIYFLYKHHPAGCFSWMEKSGHNRSGEEEAGQGGGPPEGWGKRREEGRAFSSRKRGKKKIQIFFADSLACQPQRSKKYPLFPPSTLQTPISVCRDTFLCPSQRSTSPKAYPGRGPWCPVECRVLWVLPYQHN